MAMRAKTRVNRTQARVRKLTGKTFSQLGHTQTRDHTGAIKYARKQAAAYLKHRRSLGGK